MLALGAASLAADGAGVVFVTLDALAAVVGVVTIVANFGSVTVGVAIVAVTAIVGAGCVGKVGAGVAFAIGARASTLAWWSSALLLQL